MYDVVVIGAGQAGLALGAALKRAGRSVLLIDEQPVGARWRGHYDSLVLFTPRRYSSLPGLPMPGDPDGYAGKDEFADYLAHYAKHFELEVAEARVQKVSKDENFLIETSRDTYRARQVVVAVGSGVPVMPGEGLHASAYKNPHEIPPGSVLIVGGGNSGAQIAVELSQTHEVTIALKEPLATISPTYLGKSFYWWQEVFGIDRLPSDSWLGKFFARNMDFVVGTELPRAISDGKIAVRPEVLSCTGKTVRFANGESETFRTIIFATGYRPDYSFLAIPDALTHTRGESVVPGLYFVGLRNQITNVSGNIYGTHINTPYLLKRMLA